MREKILEVLLKTSEYISGEELSRLLGVSRTAIWKNIKKLKEEGYTIKSVTNKGYKLLDSPDKLYKEEISVLLKDMKNFNQVFTYDTIDSTNNEAKRSAINNNISSGIFISEEQTEGKGRRGRNWISPLYSGIWMSLLIRPNIHPKSASMLTLMTGLAVTKAINNYTNLKAKIKWPNDIVVNGKKICGILTEMSSEMEYVNYVVVGIGINVNTDFFPEDITNIATSLKIEGKKKYSRKELLVNIIKEFEILYDEFLKNNDLELIREEYNRLCVNVDRDIKVEKSGEIIIGQGLGINSNGELIVKTKENTQIIVTSGEVSVRGLYGYV
jgi:BirA family biotin operon repressor/biotin-[acetyl-CoA-carboxylase] ligase